MFYLVLQLYFGLYMFAYFGRAIEALSSKGVYGRKWQPVRATYYVGLQIILHGQGRQMPQLEAFLINLILAKHDFPPFGLTTAPATRKLLVVFNTCRTD